MTFSALRTTTPHVSGRLPGPSPFVHCNWVGVESIDPMFASVPGVFRHSFNFVLRRSSTVFASSVLGYKIIV